MSDTRSEILHSMQMVAPPGQVELDGDALLKLRGLTNELTECSREEAKEEFERFIGVAERSLDLREDKLGNQLADKKVLVTGGTGCIGSALLRELVKYGPQAIVSISRGVTLPRQTTEGVDYRHVDIRSRNTTKEVIGKVEPDIIYHLAAQHNPSLAETEVNRTLATNIFGTQNLLDAAKEVEVPQIIYASTGKALRPYTPDVYASSKKVSEWLMAKAASESRLTCSGVRFTHVVDNSLIFKRIQHWIDTDSPIRLHGSNILFYMQSARESAHLLLNAGLEADVSNFRIEAIRDLEWPVNLVDLALGAIIRRKADTPIYIAGYEQGYEEVPYPGLYDPKYSGELSPLVSAFEAPQAQHSPTCRQVDSFPFDIETTSEMEDSLAQLKLACSQDKSNTDLRHLEEDLSWEMWQGRLCRVPFPTLERSIKQMTRYPNYDQLPPEHIRTSEMVRKAFESRNQIL
ncbi:MAG TPA: SDR family NAD(P)-dependent oxidoreductase [Candidatus Saccharimonadales bacterium]|nr:SDR family NAD(P)-dependent oxidoreductase [Candidatus Saccharimonadales bacterium]